jgi:acyl carrier protein
VTGSARPSVAGELRQILADVTGNPALAGLPAGTALFGAGVGLDSLAGTLLLRQVQLRFGVDVAGEDLNLDSLATLATLAAFIDERAPGRAGAGGSGADNGVTGQQQPTGH